MHEDARDDERPHLALEGLSDASEANESEGPTAETIHLLLLTDVPDTAAHRRIASHNAASDCH